MRVYMAGPLFTTAEQEFNRLLAEQLRFHGHEVFLPQEHEQDIKNLTKIFLSDKAGVDWCQLVLGNLDGPDPDSGTCWELGYGYGTNKAIMVYRTDFRIHNDDPINLMLTESANVVLIEPLISVQMLAERLDNEIRHRFETPSQRAPIKADQFGGFDRASFGTIAAQVIRDDFAQRHPLDGVSVEECLARGENPLSDPRSFVRAPYGSDGVATRYRHSDK